MAATKIEWADKVCNPITGCTPISEACDHCYAKRQARRFKGRYGYPADDPFRVTFHRDRLEEPLKWKNPKRIFVCSMGDIFHEGVDKWWIDDILDACLAAPQHTYMFLTKRPQNITKKLDGCSSKQLEFFSTRAWLGVTAETQARADERLPILLQIQAAVRFVSIEPMLGPVSLRPFKRVNRQRLGGLDWVICGGETGPGARPMHPDWVRSLRDQCVIAGVPFFFKGWGEWAPSFRYYDDEDQDAHDVALDMADALLSANRGRWNIDEDGQPPPDTTIMHRIGKKNAGRMLDGREWNEFPDKQ